MRRCLFCVFLQAVHLTRYRRNNTSLLSERSNMHNVKSPPVNLDKYLEGDKKRYLTYEEAARRYSIPYIHAGV